MKISDGASPLSERGTIQLHQGVEAQKEMQPIIASNSSERRRIEYLAHASTWK